ncbi:Pentapeptide repeat-containing protein [Clostridium collagenovorans DSM 3089]|uniref:Pentapeptide repeat-containing protein n=1 Tax=Clostridium collagenovorans DSM 3089 TaxID=1121306 RepID=A0A1M5X954_9CLOT|nr:pentapeptide repeat-containing protein [Clostridium collagenovorans]SHH95733.1 Pentapeptide repeat-containing protein [Clostridium collagenovorans DSM 3089]
MRGCNIYKKSIENLLKVISQLMKGIKFTFDGTGFLGADTRETNFSNADLREAVFLTQGQINAAKGNRNTKLPQYLDYPVTWK